MHSTIRAITFATLIAACALCAWWWTRPEVAWFQPASTFLALVSAISGIPAERWAAAAQRRRRTIEALRHESEQNMAFFAHPAFLPINQGVGQVYPRLKLSAVDTAFLAGALYGRRDEGLRARLLEWRSAAEDLNRRLDVTEVRLCTALELDPEEIRALRALASGSAGYFRQASELLVGLCAALAPSRSPRSPSQLITRWRPRRGGRPASA